MSETTFTPRMTQQEARACVGEIHQRFRSARRLLLQLHDRRGWEALGYQSWRECAEEEFPEHASSYLYRELQAAQVDRAFDAAEIPWKVQKFLTEESESGNYIPGSHAPALAALAPDALIDVARALLSIHESPRQITLPAVEAFAAAAQVGEIPDPYRVRWPSEQGEQSGVKVGEWRGEVAWWLIRPDQGPAVVPLAKDRDDLQWTPSPPPPGTVPGERPKAQVHVDEEDRQWADRLGYTPGSAVRNWCRFAEPLRQRDIKPERAVEAIAALLEWCDQNRTSLDQALSQLTARSPRW
jgi:hypothetical protein